MRHLLMLALAPTALLLPGCPLGCAVPYAGAGDQVYQRGADSLIICSNGGYAATVSATSMEGLYSSITGAATLGTTGAFAFALVEQPDGSATGLGDGAWQPVALDQTALDHADVQCQDLVTRAWWAPSAASHVPVETAFAKPIDGYPTVDACIAAQAAGTIPESASCQDQLLLCPDGTAVIETQNNSLSVTYEDTDGTLLVNQYADAGLQSFTGKFASDGSFVSNPLVGPVTSTVTWHTVPRNTNGLVCN